MVCWSAGCDLAFRCVTRELAGPGHELAFSLACPAQTTTRPAHQHIRSHAPRTRERCCGGGGGYYHQSHLRYSEVPDCPPTLHEMLRYTSQTRERVRPTRGLLILVSINIFGKYCLLLEHDLLTSPHVHQVITYPQKHATILGVVT